MPWCRVVERVCLHRWLERGYGFKGELKWPHRRTVYTVTVTCAVCVGGCMPVRGVDRMNVASQINIDLTTVVIGMFGAELFFDHFLWESSPGNRPK